MCFIAADRRSSSEGQSEIVHRHRSSIVTRHRLIVDRQSSQRDLPLQDCQGARSSVWRTSPEAVPPTASSGSASGLRPETVPPSASGIRNQRRSWRQQRGSSAINYRTRTAVVSHWINDSATRIVGRLHLHLHRPLHLHMDCNVTGQPLRVAGQQH